MRFSTLLIMVIISFFFISSCTYFTPVSQPSGSHINLGIKDDAYNVLGVSEGEACSNLLFGLIPLGGKKTYREAVRNALTEKGGDLLIQTSSDKITTLFLPFFSQNCIFVEGIVIKFK